MTRLPKTPFVSAIGAAALLALFAAGCQRDGGATADSGKPAPAAAATASLDTFKTGDLAQLDFVKSVPVPASSFIDADGKEHTLAEYKGKVLVVNIWGEWCAPCVEEMPTLAKLQQAFPMAMSPWCRWRSAIRKTRTRRSPN